MKPCPGCGTEISADDVACVPCYDRVPRDLPGWPRWRSAARRARQVNARDQVGRILDAVAAWLTDHRTAAPRETRHRDR